MITTMDAPWSSSRARRISNKVFALIALVIMAAGVASILGASARANGFDECRNWSVIGDTHGLGITSNGIEEKLRERGAANTENEVYPRQSIDDVNSRVRSKNFDGRCVIVEAGTGNLANDDGRARESINRLLSTLSGAKKVYWVTPLSANDATNEWDTENFLRILNETRASNLQTIDIQHLADRGDLFDPTRVTMTSAGYEQRILAILDAIAGDETPPETTPSESSSAPAPPPLPPPPGDGGGGDDPAPPPSETSAPPVPEGPTSTGMTPGEGFGNDGFRGDPNKVSPRAFADRVSTINHFAPAADYLTIRRWGVPPIPTPTLSIVEPGSFMDAGHAALNRMLFSAASAIMSFTLTIATAAFSPGMASTALGLADRTFGWIFGGVLSAENSNIGGTGLFLSSLVMLSFLFAVIGIFSHPAQLANPRRALGMVALSVGKYMVVITFLLFMGWSSARNHGSTSVTQMNAQEAFLESGEIGGEQEMYSIPGNSQAGPSTVMTTRGIGSSDLVIDAPGTWHAFSLGWFVSWCYYVGNLVGQAMAGVPRVISGAIFDMAGAIEQGDTGTSCDRYVDAMHFAFMNTSVADRNGGVADLLRTVDLMHYDLFFRAYADTFGGPTTAAGNSWCVIAEQDRQTAGGDWLMLARVAGLYKEAAGTGNLLRGNDMTFADGRNRISAASNNIRDGLVGPREGYLVNSDGHWSTADPRYAMPLRAEKYMGATGPEASTEARFYFAACEWDPYTDQAALGKDWKGVRAMGVTGSLTIAETAEEEFDRSDPGFFEKTQVFLGKKITSRLDRLRAMDDAARDMVPEASGRAESQFSQRDTLMNSGEFYYLQDYDCLSPRNYPIGIDGDADKFGWGAGGPFPNRWNYSPLPPPQLAEVLGKAVKDAVSGTPVEKGMEMLDKVDGFFHAVTNPIETFKDSWKSMVGDDELDPGNPSDVQKYYDAFRSLDPNEDAFNRDTKFGSSRDPDTGKMYASHYAHVSAGKAAGTHLIANITMVIAALVLAIMVIIASIFGFVVNFMMSIVILFLAIALVVVIGIQLFRFNQFNPNKKKDR